MPEPSDSAEPSQEAFVGVIEARHSRVYEFAVTYWIGSHRIRREIARVEREGVVREPSAGVIVDRAEGAVVLYRNERDKRASIRLTLAEYADFLDENPNRLTLRDHGIGSIFVGLSEEKYGTTPKPTSRS